MKALEKELRGHRVLVFMDLEGTQYSHEMIEIGAHKVVLKNDLSIKKIFKGYKTYVRPKGRIGHVVTELTGITEALVKKEGVPFRVAQQGLKKYVGKDWKKCLFVTFGNHDSKIITESAEHNMDASMEEARYITHNVLDLSEFIARYIRDDRNNPLSLSNYLKLFGVEFEGKKHDALADTYNLVLLYKAFLENPEIVQREYKKVLSKLHHLPTPIQKVLEKLVQGESVSPDLLDNEIKEYLK